MKLSLSEWLADRHNLYLEWLHFEGKGMGGKAETAYALSSSLIISER